MHGDPFDRHQHGNGVGHIHRKPRGHQRQGASCLYLHSLGRCVLAAELEHADVTDLVIEDLCWSIAMVDWTDRRPAPWRRKDRAAWRADGDLLQDKRHRLGKMAREAGIWSSHSSPDRRTS